MLVDPEFVKIDEKIVTEFGYVYDGLLSMIVTIWALALIAANATALWAGSFLMVAQ